MSSQTTPDDRAAATRGFAPIPRRYEEPRAGPAFEVLGMIAGGVFGLVAGACVATLLALLAWLLVRVVPALLGGPASADVGDVGAAVAAIGSIVLTILAVKDVRHRVRLRRAAAVRPTISEVTLRVSQIPLALAVVVELAWIVRRFIR